MDSSPLANPFDRLPFEMMTQIFDFLPIESKKTARLVCKQWEYILRNCLWFSFQLNDDSTKWVLNSDQNIDRVTVKNLKCPLSISTTRGASLSTAHELVISSQVTSDNFRKVLHSCPNINILALSCPDLNTLQPLSLVRSTYPMNNLCDLHLAFLTFDRAQTAVLKKLAETATPFPCLTTFEIRWGSTKLPQTKFQAFYEAYLYIHRFIWKHQATIKLLDLDFSDIISSGWIARTISINSTMQSRHQFLMENPPPRVSMLSIGVPQYEGEYPWNLCTALARAQTNLIKAGIDLGAVMHLGDRDDDISGLGKAVFSVNSGLLAASIVTPDFFDFDCASLAGCSSLVYLYIESYRAIQNVQKMPKNIFNLALEGRPTLSSVDRRWIAENLTSLESLRINVLSHPLFWQVEDNQESLIADLETFLRMESLKTLVVTTYVWYRYEDLLNLSLLLGFSYTSRRDLDFYHVTFEFTKNPVP